MASKIIKTELFEIYFSRDKTGRPNKKFEPNLKRRIMESVRKTEEVIYQILSLSRTPPNGEMYRVPIIFEKISVRKFSEKHTDRYAMLDYPPIGTIWNKTVKYEGIEITSRTGIISLCPIEEDDLFETISHEITHAFFNSFIVYDGVNKGNYEYFTEGITEFITKITSGKKIQIT